MRFVGLALCKNNQAVSSLVTWFGTWGLKILSLVYRVLSDCQVTFKQYCTEILTCELKFHICYTQILSMPFAPVTANGYPSYMAWSV